MVTTLQLHSSVNSTFARFLVAGGASYVVNQIALVVLYDFAFAGLPRLGASPAGVLDPALLLASLIAVEVSIVVRFAINDRWTFAGRCKKPLIARFWQSNLSSFGSVAIALVAVNVLTPYFGISYLVANSIGILLGLCWNWLWSSRVIWRQQPSTQGRFEPHKES